jgi:DNA processing protein
MNETTWRSKTDGRLLELIIIMLPGLRLAERLSLLQTFDREEEIIVQSKWDIEEIINRRIDHSWDMGGIIAKAQCAAAVCRTRSIEWVSWNDTAYPPLLREMYDPPTVIFYRGSLPNPEKPLLGMVGTRRPSPQAASQAYAIAFGTGQAGVSVVSGLALGIDAMSHRGNLLGIAPGYAVLGSGLDEIYPSANRPLAKRILDSGGALISEYPPGTPAYKQNFPARNRIISALSRSVLVVEAPQKSGSLLTAGFALEQGRELWVASSGVSENFSSIENGGALFDKRGTIRLAADGAEIIYSARDVLDRWNIGVSDNGDTIPVRGASGRELAASMANFLEIEL